MKADPSQSPRKTILRLGWMALLLLPGGCQTVREEPPTAGEPSRFFLVADRGFGLDLREQSVRFHLVLELLPGSWSGAPLHLTFYYPNPENPDAPLEDRRVFDPEQSPLAVRSPPIPGLIRGKRHEIRIETRAAESDPRPMESVSVWI